MGHLLPAGVLLYVQYTTIRVEFQVLSSGGGVLRNWFSLSASFWSLSGYRCDVKWIQWHLWRFGLLLDKAGNPDATQIGGKWGMASDKALETAQRRLGLLQDRKCGSLSRKAFKQV